MATNNRFFQDGMNEYQGYKVNVVRFVGAYGNNGQSRIAAHHWGTITTPSGEIIEMGQNGMTTTEIKKKIERLSQGCVGYTAREYNRGGEQKSSSRLRELIKAKSTLEKLGMSTYDIDQKITEERERIVELANNEYLKQEALKEKKELSKRMDKLMKTIEKLRQLDVPCSEQERTYLGWHRRYLELCDIIEAQ